MFTLWTFTFAIFEDFKGPWITPSITFIENHREPSYFITQ